MSIHEQAQHLAAVADQVPVGNAQAVTSELEGLQRQVYALLGETAGANEIQGAIGQAAEQANNLNAALEQVRAVILEKANYHQQG